MRYLTVSLVLQELENFKGFVSKRPPFDVVIDGLNVANTLSRGNESETVCARTQPWFLPLWMDDLSSEAEKEGLVIGSADGT